MNGQKLTPQQAYQKIKQYCAYQERCHSEVRGKLYSYSLTGPEAGKAISKLVEENYLNEERFAVQFAGGKFRIKQWGRVKIKYELKQKRVSEYNIKIGIKEIEEEEYIKTLQKLTEKKWTSIKGEGVNHFVKLSK